jgi:hypothetical protein
MKRRLLTTFAALSTLAAVCLGATPARADICGDIFDECELADGVFAWNFDQFEEYNSLDTATCQKMTDSVLAQCQAAVKAAAKCWNGQLAAVPKTAKPACKTEGAGASECNQGFKNAAAEENEEVAFFAARELECCAERALEFFEDCRDGF